MTDIEIMTPTTLRWPDFVARLEPDLSQYRCSGDGTQLDPKTGEIAAQEQPTHWLSRRLLTEMRCDVEASLAHFREHGGYCDCEVIYNVDPGTRARVEVAVIKSLEKGKTT
jgi:hypothetical protein